LSAEDSPSPTTPAGTPEPEPQKGPQPEQQSVHGSESAWAFWRSVLLTLAVALGIRQFLLEARFIPSGSMLPGLQIQDRLLVEKISFRSRAPQRGEIVVFHSPFHFDPALQANRRPSPMGCLLVNLPLIGSIPGLQEPACDAYIKRVVAIPGDRVVVNPRGQLSINGQTIRETYVQNFCPIDSQGTGPCRTLDTVVPPGAVLALGDNRANSWDGRFWPGGPFLPRKEIIGRAFYRFWPLDRTGPLGDPDPLSGVPAKAGAAAPSPVPAP
jgi:signal peptidase I